MPSSHPLTAQPPVYRAKKPLGQRLRKNLTGYAFISPFIIGFLSFTLVPMIISLYLSFTKYNLFAPLNGWGWTIILRCLQVIPSTCIP